MSVDDLALDSAVTDTDSSVDTSPVRESFDVEPPYDTAAGELPEDPR